MAHGTPPRNPERTIPWQRLAGAALLALGIAALWLRGRTPAPAARRSVVLILVDTLRWDRVSAYGAERITTPHIDAMAAEGVRFERAYTVAPWTMPTVATILTGLYPSQHGLTAIPQKLDRSLQTVPEVLAARGWATGAVVSHLLLREKYHFNQGFQRYDQSAGAGKIHEKITTPQVTDTAIAMLEELAGGDAPFFLMVHYFDPHYNFRAHPEYGFAPERAGRLDGDEDISQLRRMALSEPELDYIRDLYDEEVRFTDEGIGRLLAALDASGAAEDTAVVFASDHGEAFLEHGWLGHTVNLYEELVRVPLVIRAPGVAPGVIREPVSLVSLAPTLLWLAGVTDAGDLPHQTGPLSLTEEPERAPRYFEVDFVPATRAAEAKRAHKKGLVLGERKVILDQSTGRYEVYDLAADPDERAPLARDPELIGALDRAVARVSGAGGEPPPEEDMSAKEIEKLQKLGYLE